MQYLRPYIADESGSPAAEFVIIFPLMFVMILGIWDVGNGLWVGQKVIKSTHMVADLLGRESAVDDNELDQAFEAGRIAIQPFDEGPLSIEVYSISFDDDGNASIEWEDVYNGTLDDDFIDNVQDLGTDGSLVVRVNYQYVPDFADFVIDQVNMSETVYVKGRQVDVIARE